MRAMLIVPILKGQKLSDEFSLSLRYQNPASASVLQRPDCAFNHGNAAVLPNPALGKRDSRRFLSWHRAPLCFLTDSVEEHDNIQIINRLLLVESTIKIAGPLHRL